MLAAGSFRRAALSALRALSRWRESAPVAWIYAHLPVSLKARVRQSLLKVALGKGQRQALAQGCLAKPSVPIDSTRSSRAEGAVPDDGPGVNLVGYVRGGLGLAENVRSFARALMAEDFPVSLIDADILDPSRNTDDSMLAHVDSFARFAIDVYFVNPDQLGRALDATRGKLRSDAYRIGYWFWELAGVPRDWMEAIDSVDEIWVSSRFVQEAFKAVTDKPVVLIPMVVEPAITSVMERSRAGKAEPYTFLFSFDFHSYLERKNPRAVVDAFLLAFPHGSEPVRLILKTINGEVFPGPFYDLIERASADKRIVINDGFVSREQIVQMMSDADAYVSLHRSEGFGLGMAESMYLGKPVIATGYSGNLDFMTRDNSFLVSFSLCPVQPGDYMHGEGQSWAAPDIVEAAGFMTLLVSSPEEGARRGYQAMIDMKSRHSRAASSGAAIARLGEIHHHISQHGGLKQKCDVLN
jgi:glycosyltransferase involved in cell wall biosynthesis